MSKRIIAMLLAAIIALTLVACNGNNGGGVASTEPLTENDTIQVYIGSHQTWPYKEDWKVWEYIREGVKAKIDLVAVPNAEVGTKWNILFASPDLLPDVITYARSSAQQKGFEGAVIPLTDVEEYMPNFVKWKDSLSEEDYAAYITPHVAADGKIYDTPMAGFEVQESVRAWLYRKDIFEKHNLKLPTTFDELYEVCKELKKLYPNSYPLCLREIFNNFDISGPSWNGYWTTGVYYDYDTDTWHYGATEDTMLDVIKFYKKMIAEELVPPNLFNITTTEWQELVSNDRGFIMIEYMTRIDNFNNTMRTVNPEFTISAFEPPVANPETGSARVGKWNMDPNDMVLCNTRSDARIANAAKYLDWFYGDEAYELISWGKEGETYEVVDGKKRYIREEGDLTHPKVLYGFATYGAYTRLDPEAVMATDSKEISEVRDMVLGYSLPFYNPTKFISLTQDEKDSIANYESAVTTNVKEMVAKFCLGHEPLEKFEQFAADTKEMGADIIVETYKSAYERVK